MAREKLCVGIDIGASAVKLCQLKQTKRNIVLEKLAIVPLPTETVVDGALMNSARVVEAIQELISVEKLKYKRVALAISGHSVIIKKIALPQMSKEELERSIQWEAEQHIPFDINDVYIDIQVVNPISQRQGQMDVVLVAAKKDFVNEYTSVLIEAGLEPVVCDVDAFALETAFAANYDVPHDQTIALVNVGASKTNINILAAGVSSFTRDLASGGNNFTEEIQKQLRVSQDEAEDIKRAVGLNPSRPDPKADPIIRKVATSITDDISRTLDFFASTSADLAPSIIYLTGGSSYLRSLSQILAERTELPVEILDPFRRIQINSKIDPGLVESMRALGTVAVGLALRYPGDGDASH